MQVKDQEKNGTSAVKDVGITQTQESADQNISASDSMSDGPQVSISEVDSDSVDSSASNTVIPLRGSGETGSENLPVTVGMADFSHEEHLSKEKVDELVHRVIANREGADKAALATGTMLLDEVFGGLLDAALSHNPKKHKSFARICDHPDMDVDSTTLSRWVKAANLVKTFKRRGNKFKNLTCSHYIALLSLKKDENRLHLAEEADKNRFSVRRLALEVDKAEHHSRPPKTLLDTITSKLENPRDLADEEKSGSLSDREKWATLETADRRKLILRVSVAELRAETYVNSLARFDALLKEIAEEAKSDND